MLKTPIRPSSLLLLLIYLLPVTLADDAFFGCYTSPPSASTRTPDSGSASDCRTACSAEITTTYTTSYWSSTLLQCYCSTTSPEVSSLATGTKGTCGANYDGRVIRTSFTELAPQCYSTVAPLVTRQRIATTGPETCFASCRATTRALFWADTTTGSYYCYCSAGSAAAASADCGPTSYFAYSHSAEATASQLAKRSRREEKAAKKAALELLHCPHGRTACMVEGQEGAEFECIDTKSELESCGGCRWGQYGVPSAVPGEDCSTMKHAMRGGSTCMEGRCTAFACKRGFISVDGICVPIRA